MRCRVLSKQFTTDDVFEGGINFYLIHFTNVSHVAYLLTISRPVKRKPLNVRFVRVPIHTTNHNFILNRI